ncbi:transposase [Nocardia lasii]|uniref:Transposase n=1 Tax=Nocardia lasii TaxID=1616107 RepID=A0ABW1JRR8_9NOCA
MKALPWKQVPVADLSTGTGHGRRERRTLKTTAIDAGIGFPGAEQVLRMTRTRTDYKTGKRSTEIVYAITTLTVADASPALIATWLRGHWGIENRVHRVRDVTFDEGRCRARTGHAPQVLATLRNIRYRHW